MNWLWSLVGAAFFSIGAIGLFIPVWPTTVFWIIAALCFARSHPSARDWIYRQPGIGSQIENYVEHGLISWRGKVAALSGMGLGAGICALLLWRAPLWLGGSLIILSVSALYVVTRPSSPG
ncbi:MAG: YbaN family protein [Pseudomonadota bacterium]